MKSFAYAGGAARARHHRILEAQLLTFESQTGGAQEQHDLFPSLRREIIFPKSLQGLKKNKCKQYFFLYIVSKK